MVSIDVIAAKISVYSLEFFGAIALHGVVAVLALAFLRRAVPKKPQPAQGES